MLNETVLASANDAEIFTYCQLVLPYTTPTMLAITLIAVTISARNIPTIFTVFVTVIPMTDVRLIGSQSSIGILCPFDVFMRNNLYTAIWRFFFFAIAEAFPGHIFHLFPHTSI